MEAKDCFASFYDADFKRRVTSLNGKENSGERDLLENKIMWKNYRYSPFDNELDWELKVQSRSSPLNSPVLKIGPHILSIKLLIVILVRK